MILLRGVKNTLIFAGKARDEAEGVRTLTLRERERERADMSKLREHSGHLLCRASRERETEGGAIDRLTPIRQAARGASLRPYLLPQVPIAGGAALATVRSTTAA